MVGKTKKIRMPRLEDSPDKNVFVMMRYRELDQFDKIEKIITNTLYKFGLYARLARDVRKANLLWPHITRYMDQCKYGIAIFDALPFKQDEPRLNPNVCTELGYMLAKGKECLILRDQNLPRLPTDLQGFLYEAFDGNRLEGLSEKVSVFAEQVVQILPLLQGLAHLLPKESKIAKRLHEHPHEKLIIGKFLAEEYFPNQFKTRGIILDSGTTVAAVAESLFLNRSKYVYTNNLLASLLLCSTKQFRCNLVPGVVDENFAGVFGQEADDAVKHVDAQVTILACTGFTLERGPYANSPENCSFKRAIIDKTQHTIIVATDEKLGRSAALPVMESTAKWKKVLEQNVKMIVTSPGHESPAFKAIKQALGRKLKIAPL